MSKSAAERAADKVAEESAKVDEKIVAWPNDAESMLADADRDADDGEDDEESGMPDNAAPVEGAGEGPSKAPDGSASGVKELTADEEIERAMQLLRDAGMVISEPTSEADIEDAPQATTKRKRAPQPVPWISGDYLGRVK